MLRYLAGALAVICGLTAAVAFPFAPASSGPGGLPEAAQAAPRADTQTFVIAPAESQVAYKVGETFINQGNRYNLAIGVTNTVSGEIQLDRETPRHSQVGRVSVDISRFTSDSGQRDNAIRRQWLESSKYPVAEFTPTSLDGLPDAWPDGVAVPAQITGDLKVRDTVRPVTFATTITLTGDTLTGFASTQIQMTDFGFDPPSILGILKAENDATLEFTFTAHPAG